MDRVLDVVESSSGACLIVTFSLPRDLVLLSAAEAFGREMRKKGTLPELHDGTTQR